MLKDGCTVKSKMNKYDHVQERLGLGSGQGDLVCKDVFGSDTGACVGNPVDRQTDIILLVGVNNWL